MEFYRTVDMSLYPRDAIYAARLAYKDYCIVRIQPVTTNIVRFAITVLPVHENNAREVVLSFLNYALDKSVETVLQSD
jgi:hypothetical protein